MLRGAAVSLFPIVLGGICWAQRPAAPSFQQSVPITSSERLKKTDEPPPCPQTFSDGIPTKIGKDTDIIPPKAIHTVVAQMSDEARKAHKKKKNDTSVFKNVISLVVDKQGNPRDLCLKSSAGYGLDAEAGRAVRQYKFAPATRDGVSVAVRINVESSFRFY